MAQQDEVRASGMTPGDEIARKEAAQSGEPVAPDEYLGLDGGADHHPEDRHTSLTPAFSRLRTDWNAPDAEVIRQMRRGVDLMIQNRFADLFDLFYSIFEIVRDLDVDENTGVVRTDEWGVPEWKRAPSGAYIEDWSRMGAKERADFLYRITTGLFRWEQVAADLWGEAMFARAANEEAFSHGYEELVGDKPTIDDRTARARIRAAEHRYRAVYQSYLSKRSEAVVRAAERLGQRLKDLHSL
jgi:hypothetical protein